MLINPSVLILLSRHSWYLFEFFAILPLTNCCYASDNILLRSTGKDSHFRWDWGPLFLSGLRNHTSDLWHVLLLIFYLHFFLTPKQSNFNFCWPHVIARSFSSFSVCVRSPLLSLTWDSVEYIYMPMPVRSACAYICSSDTLEHLSRSIVCIV